MGKSAVNPTEVIRKQIAFLRESIRRDVNNSFCLSIDLILMENPDMPREVAVNAIREVFSDGTISSIKPEESATEIEKALLKAIDQLNEQKMAEEPKKVESSENDFLHIYGLPYWGETAIIAGNRSSFLHLEDALREALKKGSSTYEEVSTSDGEKYKVIIVMEDDSKLAKRPSPYYEAIGG